MVRQHIQILLSGPRAEASRYDASQFHGTRKLCISATALRILAPGPRSQKSVHITLNFMIQLCCVPEQQHTENSCKVQDFRHKGVHLRKTLHHYVLREVLHLREGKELLLITQKLQEDDGRATHKKYSKCEAAFKGS